LNARKTDELYEQNDLKVQYVDLISIYSTHCDSPLD